MMLRISANSTRRARWDAQLGFQRYSHPFPVQLSSLFANGGLIGCIDIVVRKRYPLEYMEKTSSGTTVFRNARAEERETKNCANDLERAREAVLAKVLMDFETHENKAQNAKKLRRSYSPQDIRKLRCGQELYEVCMAASDPGFIEECLDINQRKSLEDYRRLMQDTKREKLQKMFQEAWEGDKNIISKRNVVHMLKVRLVNYLNCEEDKTEAILTVWRPTEDVIQLLREGNRLRIYQVMASGSRYRQGLPSLQLSSTRNTRYKVMNSDESAVEDVYTNKKITSFDDLQSGSVVLNSEVDLVGCVVQVVSHNNSSLQTVYLADVENNLVAVKFWGGLKVYAVDDLVKPKNIVACTNLFVRSNEHVNSTTLAYSELSTLTLKPRESYLRTALESLRDGIKDMNGLISSCQKLLDEMCHRSLPSSAMSNNSPSENLAPQQDYSKRAESTKSTCTGDKLAPKTMSSFILHSGACKRKLLDKIPQPPAAPSLNISSTKGVRRDFKRPRRLTTSDQC